MRRTIAISASVLLTASLNASAQTLRLVVAPQGNEARYLVREELLDVEFPSDAIGKTSKIEGRIVVGSNGVVWKDSSSFTIDLASLQSDRNMRDNYIRRRTLQTDQFATAVFVPAELRNLKFPLPKSGDVAFQMLGDLTVRGVTRPVTWDVTAKTNNGSLTGLAKTTFTFADFQLEKPRVRSVLTVEDDIRLEYSFYLVPTH